MITQYTTENLKDIVRKYIEITENVKVNEESQRGYYPNEYIFKSAIAEIDVVLFRLKSVQYELQRENPFGYPELPKEYLVSLAQDLDGYKKNLDAWLMQWSEFEEDELADYQV